MAAGDGEGALARVRERGAPDLAILDVMMRTPAPAQERVAPAPAIPRALTSRPPPGFSSR
jgi:CheY-like chemotaxis protein